VASVFEFDRKDTGLAEMVGQSEAALTGLSDREVELVSDKCGEYFLCSGCLHSMFRTRFALFGTTLAVFMTGDDRVRIGVAETRLSRFSCLEAGVAPCGYISCLATAVEG